MQEALGKALVLALMGFLTEMKKCLGQIAFVYAYGNIMCLSQIESKRIRRKWDLFTYMPFPLVEGPLWSSLLVFFFCSFADVRKNPPNIEK